MPAWVPYAHLYGSLILYICGVTIMIASDCQKSVLLQTVKQRPFLIANGMFERTRNPNYFGEIMLYSAFAATSNHIVSYAILLWAMSSIYFLRIWQKELSLRQKPGFLDDYAKRSNILIPRVLGGWFDHLALLIIIVLIYQYILSYSFVGISELKWPF